MAVAAGIEWRVASLGELVDVFDHVRVPVSSRERAKRPYYGASGIIDYIDAYLFDGEYLIISEDGENLNSRKTPVAFLASGKFWVNNHAHIVRAKSELADDYFLMSVIESMNISGYVSGAAQPKLTQENLRSIKIRIPPLTIQRKIAAILSAYDDLIANNTRRIALLEEMARGLYHEWFFRLRYPGHAAARLVDSPLGPIPEGWEVVTLRDCTSYINRGISPRYADDSPSLVINQKCIRDGRLSLSYARHHATSVAELKQIRSGDVLINSTGIGTLGRVAQVIERVPDCTVDSHVSIVRPSHAIGIDYFGLALLGLEPLFDSMGAGTTGQTELSRDSIASAEIILPSHDIQMRFSDLVSPMRAAALTFGHATDALRQTRDLLLPQLVSGSVDVAEIGIESETGGRE